MHGRKSSVVRSDLTLSIPADKKNNDHNPNFVTPTAPMIEQRNLIAPKNETVNFNEIETRVPEQSIMR